MNAAPHRNRSNNISSTTAAQEAPHHARRESSHLFMQHSSYSSLHRRFNPPEQQGQLLNTSDSRQRNNRAGDASLQNRNEVLAIEIGVLIERNNRLKSTIRNMQRQRFTEKADVSTQTDERVLNIKVFFTTRRECNLLTTN